MCRPIPRVKASVALITRDLKGIEALSAQQVESLHFCLAKYRRQTCAPAMPGTLVLQGTLNAGGPCARCIVIRPLAGSCFALRQKLSELRKPPTRSPLLPTIVVYQLEFLSPGRSILYSCLLDNGDSAHSDLHTLISTPRHSGLTDSAPP